MFVSYAQISAIKKFFVVKYLPAKKPLGPDDFPGKYYEGEIAMGFTEVFLGNRKKGNAFHDVSIALVSV